MDAFTLIGAIAAVAGLVDVGVKLCISLNDMAKIFSSAPDAMSLMERDVSSLVSVLQQLQAALEEGNSNGLALSLEARINLHNILQNCELVLASLETILDKFEHYPKGLEGASATVTKIKAIKLRFRWMIEESEVVKIRRSLDSHVGTLQLTLTVTTTLVAAVIKRDTTEIIRRLEDLSFNLKRTATLTSETVVRPLAQTPDQPIIHNQSTTPTTQHEIKVQIPTAVIVEQAAIAELHSVSSFSSHEPTPIPAIVEPNELESVHIARPSLQHASASSLTVSNQERSSPDRSRSRSPKRHPPVNVVPGKTLFVAARAGKKDILLRILRGGAKITEVEPDGTTVLQAAAEKNQLDVVLSLLFFGADPNLGGGQMSSPILAATDRQHVQVVAALLEAGADPSVVHPEALPWMKSAVHSALYRQNSEILSMLLRARAADPNGIPGLLQYACHAGTLNSVKQLLDTGLDINDFSNSTTALQVAVGRNHTAIVRFLLERNADPNITFLDSLPWERSPLSAAIYKQNTEILSILLSTSADPKRIPGLLRFACSYGSLDSVKQLLDAGLDINDFSNSTTALQVAVGRNHTAIVRFLLERNADPNITFLDSLPWERSPLSAAIYKQNAEILSILLGAGADPNKVPGLLPYATETNDFQCVKMMIEGNANIDSIDDNLGTALQVAAAKGKRDVLIYLLDCGADPTIEGGRYGSALNAAITNGHEDCVIELLGGGIDD